MPAAASSTNARSRGRQGSPYLEATPYVDGQVGLVEAGVPVLWWRSVGATHNAFVMEHTIDQLARKAGKRPGGLSPRALRQGRRRRGTARDRHLAALNLAAREGRLGRAGGPG